MPKKPEKQALTQELLERLSQDAYCFNSDHDKDIETLKAESEKLKKAYVDKTASAEIDKKSALEGRDKTIGDLEEKIEGLEEQINVLTSSEAELSEKLKNAMVEAAKKFKDEGKCFDIFHRMIVGQSKEFMDIPELFAFAITLISSVNPDGSDYRFTLFMDPALARYAESAKKALDVKRARDIGDRLKKEGPGIFGF